jgi:hypothetical protein
LAKDSYSGLFHGGRDGIERIVQLGAEAVDDSDDRHGNTCGDQPILYGSGAGLVLQKRNNFGHLSSSELSEIAKTKYETILNTALFEPLYLSIIAMAT